MQCFPMSELRSQNLGNSKRDQCIESRETSQFTDFVQTNLSLSKLFVKLCFRPYVVRRAHP